MINKNEEKFSIALKDDFSLSDTLECGQCFRWNKIHDQCYDGVINGEKVIVQLNGKILTFCTYGVDNLKDQIIKYFDLDTNYSKIKENLSSRYKNLDLAIKYAPGIRILNQNPFETLCSFIISQNNNIKRISKIVNTLCEQFGKKSEHSDVYSFPTPKRLAELAPEDLDVLRCGFRVPYLLDAFQKIASGKVNLENLREMPLDEARQQLMTIYGVGPKVAECTLLYGLHRLDAFPIDVWMKRAMKTFFPNVNPNDFGPYAGVAQQYIFHYTRTAQNNIPKNL